MNDKVEILAELLGFISDIALAIRMSSSYNRASLSNPNTPDAVMALSDMMHNLNMISSAIVKGSNEDLLLAINCHIDQWTKSKESINKAARENHPIVFDVENGIEILTRLKSTLTEAQG